MCDCVYVVNIGGNSAEGRQPSATVSKSGAESRTEGEYRQIHPTSSLERSGSLRDRWRQLNEEFKRVYQQNSSQTTPSKGHVGQRRVTKVNRFKDVDQRFSNVSRAVGQMSARQICNITSGKPVTSSKTEVVGPLGWYPDSRNDEKQSSSCVYSRQSSVLPSGECKYKTVCTRCGKTFITSSRQPLDYDEDDAAAAAADADDRIPQPRDSYREDRRPARVMVILSV